MTEDQKRYLVFGAVGSAFALFVGSMILGERKATAAPMTSPMLGPSGRPGPGGQPSGARTKRRHHEDGDERDREQQGNGRGEYGQKKKHHHKGHRHGH